MGEPKLDTQNLWLFNVTADPQETTDLSESRPDVVQDLLHRLVFYNSTASEARFIPLDNNHFPNVTGDAWMPWLKIRATVTEKVTNAPCAICDTSDAMSSFNRKSTQLSIVCAVMCVISMFIKL